MTTEEIINQIKQAQLTLRDDRIVEHFTFIDGDHVVATIGEKNGPVCGPVLYYRINGTGVVIADHDGEVWFQWDSLELDRNTLTVQCSGRKKVFDIKTAKPRRRFLP